MKFLIKIKDVFVLFIKTFIKPFWFSSSICKKEMVVPYFYTSVNMLFFYASVYLFLKLSWMAGTVGIQSPAVVLPTLAGVIGTLIVLNHSMLTIYNKSRKAKMISEEYKIQEKPGKGEKGVMEE